MVVEKAATRRAAKLAKSSVQMVVVGWPGIERSAELVMEVGEVGLLSLAGIGVTLLALVVLAGPNLEPCIVVAFNTPVGSPNTPEGKRAAVLLGVETGDEPDPLSVVSRSVGERRAKPTDGPGEKR